MTTPLFHRRGAARVIVASTAVILIGMALRLWAAAQGHNFDVESYAIVARIMAEGGNVYNETPRYNYGPVWFHVLHALDLLGPSGPQALRWKVATFLTLVDVGIFAFLVHRYSVTVGCLFFLNPVSVLITGYHSQFDNLAVLVALLAVAHFDPTAGRLNRWICMAALGLSLTVKHLLFVFPFWLALKERTWSGRLVVLLTPVLLFLLSFLPYLPLGAVGIAVNVFLYRSKDNGPLWSTILPDNVLLAAPMTAFFIVALLALGWWVRRKSPLESLHYYLIGLVAFTSAMANQYLAICIPALAVRWNWVFALYSLAGGVYLAVHRSGLAFQPLESLINWRGELAYPLLACLLAAGLLVAMLRDWRQHRADCREQTSPLTPA